MLRVLFYWYNFMPLSRGTAAVGFISVLAMTSVLFNTKLNTPLPPRLQLDWEAILEERCEVFTSKIRRRWLDYAINRAECDLSEEPPTVFANKLPSVGAVVKTVRDAVMCLNASI